MNSSKSELTPMPPPIDLAPAPIREPLERVLLGVFFLVLLVMIAMAAWAWQNSRKSIETTDWINHTHAVILEVNSILSSLNASESALRDFLLSREASAEQFYRQSVADLREHMQVADSLAASSAQQRAALMGIENAVAQQLGRAQLMIQGARTQPASPAALFRSLSESHANIAAIRRQVRQLEQNENESLHENDVESRRRARWTRSILFAGLAADFLLLAACLWVIRRDLALRRESADFLRKTNQLLDLKVEARTAELAKANEALEIENIERRWAAEAAQRLLRHSEAIINAVAEPVIVVSRAGNILRLNPAAATLAGADGREWVGRSIESLLGARGADGIRQGMDHARDRFAGLAELRPKTGGAVPVRFACDVLSESGKAVCAVVTLTRRGPP